ncbi:MAG: hypothetical protein AB4080_10425 [Trichodesmium sp.]
MLKKWLLGVGYGDTETRRWVAEQAKVLAILCEEIFWNFSRKSQ